MFSGVSGIGSGIGRFDGLPRLRLVVTDVLLLDGRGGYSEQQTWVTDAAT